MVTIMLPKMPLITYYREMHEHLRYRPWVMWQRWAS